MVTKLHRDALLSDIAAVSALLVSAQGRDPLGEMSLKQRLTALEQQLRELDAEPLTTASVALVFDGAPVRGSSAIDADFAGQALQDYQELLTRQVASSIAGGMGARGPIPTRVKQQARMNITALVHGSFGFLLEESGSEQTALLDTPAQVAVQAVTDLLRGISDSDDTWFEQRLPDLDVRLFQSLRRFISTLHSADSTLKLSEHGRDLRLTPKHVELAHARVTQVDVDELEETILGELLGIVPIARRFEFRRADDGEVISGRVAESLSADYLERLEREELIGGKGWRALIRTKTVTRADGRHSSVSRTLIDLLQE